jgi:DNA-binding IclR family transcriptional regulator
LCEWDETSLVAKWTPEALADVMGQRIFKSTQELIDELQKVRQQGFSVVDEEFEIGVVGCSAPIRDASGRIVAALNIGAPKARLESKLDQAARLTRKVAKELSQTLYSPS